MTADTWPRPSLPRDRCYAADLQLGCRLTDDGGRVTLLKQEPDGRIRVEVDGGADGPRWHQPTDVLAVSAPVAALSREAVQALRRLSDETEALAAAEHRTPAAPVAPDPRSAAGPSLTNDGYWRVNTRWITATYHLIAPPAHESSHGGDGQVTALCGITRHTPDVGHEDGWRHAGPDAVRLCNRCRWQKEHR